MKKIYYIDVDSEFFSEIVWFMNEKVDRLFETRKQAFEYLVKAKNYLKERYNEDLHYEKKIGNTITINLYKVIVPKNVDIHKVEVFDYDYSMIDSRYLCGRY